ncbi:hypothetical protein [Halobacillus amylolyticus]|uniref:Multi-TM2 domain-containing protein n=1 Tax=Halobacillus amylolyticus TaxID=2932259 RepID=A0ABY4HFJ7_9BACI|nr:hypothetical protein [Halobacillus amylolyticus]UOR13427.1 hypothetical protein MUO15_08215 [Halobacillus amylolyticus]
MNKSPILAFFLAFIPGFGHMYLGRAVRGILYPLIFFTALGFGFVMFVFQPYSAPEILYLLAFSFLVWGANMLDITLTLLQKNKRTDKKKATSLTATVQAGNSIQNERFFTILLSFLPGVGHFQLGLKQRGLTFLAIYLGAGMMIIFVTFLTSQAGFLLFLPALLIIWVYNLFDVIQLLNKRQAGYELEDRPLMDDWNELRKAGHRNNMLTILLAIFPGAGHLYLGLQKRGIQLMLFFLLSIYILDVLRLSVFLFLIPILWFFSFFDALQQMNRVQQGEVNDQPVIKNFLQQKRRIGAALLVLGGYYLADSVLLPVFADQISRIFHIDIWYYYQQYFQVGLVSLLLMGGGLYLLTSKRSKEKSEEV